MHTPRVYPINVLMNLMLCHPTKKIASVVFGLVLHQGKGIHEGINVYQCLLVDRSHDIEVPQRPGLRGLQDPPFRQALGHHLFMCVHWVNHERSHHPPVRRQGRERYLLASEIVFREHHGINQSVARMLVLAVASAIFQWHASIDGVFILLLYKFDPHAVPLLHITNDLVKISLLLLHQCAADDVAFVPY
jgi:hypothetical protein